MNMNVASNERGFTLLELVIVILLLGLLVAVIFPYYLQYQRSANNAVAINAYGTMAQAIRSVCSGINITNRPLAITAVPTTTQVGLVLNNGAEYAAIQSAVNGVTPTGHLAGVADCGNTTALKALQMIWTGSQFGSGGALTCTTPINGVASPADCVSSS